MPAAHAASLGRLKRQRVACVERANGMLGAVQVIDREHKSPTDQAQEQATSLRRSVATGVLNNPANSCHLPVVLRGDSGYKSGTRGCLAAGGSFSPWPAGVANGPLQVVSDVCGPARAAWITSGCLLLGRLTNLAFRAKWCSLRSERAHGGEPKRSKRDSNEATLGCILKSTNGLTFGT